MSESKVTHMKNRFRGFLPVVVDIETGGFNCKTDAILEIAMTTLTMDDAGLLTIDETHSRNVEPFEGEPHGLALLLRAARQRVRHRVVA